MITRIILENYMSHGRTVIEPAAGLTVIVGPNNCGKSAIVSALQTLCGDNDGDFMVRHGEKGCQVSVETEDGHTITWRRKGKSVSYVLDGVEVHRVGRGNLPDDLQTLLRLPKVRHPSDEKKEFDVHFADQKAPIFLIDKEADTAAFFSTASDAEKLLEMQKRHKEKVRDARREHQRCIHDAAEVEGLLAALSPLDEINARLEAVEEIDGALLADEQEIAALSMMIKQIEGQGDLVAFHGQLLSVVTLVWSPPLLVDSAPLEQDVLRLGRAKAAFEACGARVDALEKLCEPPALSDEETLGRLCDGIMQGASSIRRIGAVLQSLGSLSEPPTALDTQGLSGFLGRFEGAQAALASAGGRQAVLCDLREPCVVEDLAPLAELIDRMTRGASAAAQQRQAIAEHERNLSGLDADINAWLWANPSCPTCGGVTTRENLLMGAHAHGSVVKGGIAHE